MTNWWVSLGLASFVLGIVFCAPPGMVAAESIRRGVAHGFWPALRVQLGSLIGDGTWAAIAMIGAAFLVQNALARWVLGLIGASLLLYLAWNALRDAWAGTLPNTTADSARSDFVTGALLSLSNPYAVAFWLGVGTSTITQVAPTPQPVHFVVFFAAFMTGALLWCFFFAGLVAGGRRLLSPGFFRVVNLVCAVALGYFGVTLLWATLA